jgi:hypothetical protein
MLTAYRTNTGPVVEIGIVLVLVSNRDALTSHFVVHLLRSIDSHEAVSTRKLY